jgi:hypothetical protein
VKQLLNDAKASKKQQKKNPLQSISWDIDDSPIEAVDNIGVPSVATTRAGRNTRPPQRFLD